MTTDNGEQEQQWTKREKQARGEAIYRFADFGNWSLPEALGDRILADHAQAALAQKWRERAELAERLRHRLDGPVDVMALVDWFIAAYDNSDALAPSAGQED